ncbi:MAG: aldehyde dehydrogenase family protein [Thermoanaerobaculia bacterium]|nr:aldehyde dehydrogenase family protein [Thermoanaerobaculia bacterium]
MRDRLYIDGQWQSPAAGGTFAVENPATGEVIHQAPAATAADVDRAVLAARRAFTGSWGATTGAARAVLLRAFAERITARREELAALEVRDNGKPLPEALWDVDDAAGCFAMYADLAVELDGRQESSLALPDSRFSSQVRLEPVGVAGQIIPWNYPLLMAAWKVAPALAAGATVVLKPSELTPLTALELGAIADEIGLPAGVLNILSGTGAEAGEPLTQHREVDKLAFTGSVPTGRRVMMAAAQEVKNVSLELGGKSPFVVFADADVEAAVEWVMFGIFWNQGQVCSATSRLLVEEALAPRLLARLAEEAGKIPIGDGFAPGTLLGPLVSRGQYEKVVGFIDRARAEKIPLLTGGGRPPGLERGYFLEPTIFADVPVDSELWREEVFGPVLAVRSFRGEDEAVRLANDTRFGLAAAVMSADLDRCRRVARRFRAGIVWINCSQPTFSQAPWGGMKQSGIGRELGRWGLENYLEVKQVTTYESSEPWGWYLKP